MRQSSRTFVVRVLDGAVIVVEDVRTGEHARVSALEQVGEQIKQWLATSAGSRIRDGRRRQPG